MGCCISFRSRDCLINNDEINTNENFSNVSDVSDFSDFSDFSESNSSAESAENAERVTSCQCCVLKTMRKKSSLPQLPVVYFYRHDNEGLRINQYTMV